ncbi:MAG TPA: transcriptional regulator [Thermoanaerobaculia bacterium]|jgi:DNA-binding MarR family transcriptional regulator
MVGKTQTKDQRPRAQGARATRGIELVGARERSASPGRLDRVIHERVRLGIVSALAVNESLTFNELKTLLRATDGNVSVHARKLERAGYVACVKSFEGRIPRTTYRLTAAGRRALSRYLDHMEAVIRAARHG